MIVWFARDKDGCLGMSATAKPARYRVRGLWTTKTDWMHVIDESWVPEGIRQMTWDSEPIRARLRAEVEEG